MEKTNQLLGNIKDAEKYYSNRAEKFEKEYLRDKDLASSVHFMVNYEIAHMLKGLLKNDKSD